MRLENLVALDAANSGFLVKTGHRSTLSKVPFFLFSENAREATFYLKNIHTFFVLLVQLTTFRFVTSFPRSFVHHSVLKVLQA